jgi:hypothetical protein
LNLSVLKDGFSKMPPPAATQAAARL